MSVLGKMRCPTSLRIFYVYIYMRLYIHVAFKQMQQVGGKTRPNFSTMLKYSPLYVMLAEYNKCGSMPPSKTTAAILQLENEKKCIFPQGKDKHIPYTTLVEDVSTTLRQGLVKYRDTKAVWEHNRRYLSVVPFCL